MDFQISSQSYVAMAMRTKLKKDIKFGTTQTQTNKLFSIWITL